MEAQMVTCPQRLFTAIVEGYGEESAAGTKVELHGCANDVKRMYKTLTSRFGFDESDILVLVDTDKSGVQPTGVNIRSYLAKVIRGVEPGDALVFHYSGHGTQVRTEGGALDDIEEAILPTDMNLLTELKQHIARYAADHFRSRSTETTTRLRML